MLRFKIIALAFNVLTTAPAFARHCTKGKPCGNSCIAKSEVCHKQGGSADLSSEAPEAPAAKTKVCKKGKACGNTCIPQQATCNH